MGQRLGKSESAVKSEAFRLRQRYGELVRAEIAQTVASVAVSSSWGCPRVGLRMAAVIVAAGWASPSPWSMSQAARPTDLGMRGVMVGWDKFHELFPGRSAALRATLNSLV